MKIISNTQTYYSFTQTNPNQTHLLAIISISIVWIPYYCFSLVLFFIKRNIWKRNKNVHEQKDKWIIRIQKDAKIWRSMKQQNGNFLTCGEEKNGRKEMVSFGGRFCLHSTSPASFKSIGMECVFCACHCENWFTFNGCDSNSNINGQPSAQSVLSN